MKQKLIFLALLFISLTGFSAEYYVDASRPDDSGTAITWATAKQTIQAAVDLSVDGDTVWVTNGVYDTGGVVTPGYSLINRVCITNAITVRSVNGRDNTVIEGAAGSNGGYDLDSVRGVFLENGGTLVGFTITNGYTRSFGDSSFDQSGGGVWLTTNCVVSGCILARNSASLYGGGVALWGEGMVSKCMMTNNSASLFGGGALLVEGGMLDDCSLISNSATNDGGGAYLVFGGVISNCAVSGNLTRNNGGGVCLFEGGVLDDCTLRDNIALDGGGGVCLDGGGLLNNSKIIGNSAVWDGGGGLLLGSGEINNCTFVDNNAGNYGGGALLFEGGVLNGCTLIDNSSIDDGNGAFLYLGGTLNNCISRDVVFMSYLGGIVSHSYVCNGSYGVFDGMGGNIIGDDPGLDINLRLMSNSPCINWGDNSVVTNATDLDGNPRIVEGTVDMGAYEYQGTIGLADSDNDGINDDWERGVGGNQDPDRVCSNGVNSIYQAYIAGLNPKDPGSRFAAVMDPDQVLRWTAISGRVYSVWCSTNLLSGFQCLETNAPWTKSSFTNGSQNANGQLFYKIDVQLDEDSGSSGGGEDNPLDDGDDGDISDDDVVPPPT